MLDNLYDDRGLLLRRDAVDLGFDDKWLRRAVASGTLHRIRQGAYCATETWQQATPVERHRLASHAVRRQYDDQVARSHVSALLEMGGPDWGLDLSHVHLTDLHGRGARTQAGVVHHRGSVLVGDLTRHDGSWLTSGCRTALDTALAAPRDPAVCVLDWIQREGHASREVLDAALGLMKDWPHTIGLTHKLRLTTGLAESVGETRTHLMLRDQGIPMPWSQFEVRHPSGRVAGRVDFAWPEYGVMLEFDGLVKYTKLRQPGESIQDVVMREKQREDLLRRLTRWTMIRLVWADLDRPARTTAMIRRALERSAA